MSLSLWPHQKTIYETIKARSHWALFCEVGTGKTAIIIKLLEANCSGKAVLIACPKSVRQSWIDQIALFSDDLADRAQIVDGTPLQRNQKLRDRYKTIHVMNYETAVHSFAKLPY